MCLSKKAGLVNARLCRKWRSENPEKAIHSRVKTRSKKDGTLFTLTFDDIKIPEKCPACGVAMAAGEFHRRNTSPSLDRIVPGLGYTPENTIIICYSCNRRKSDATPEEMYAIADYVYRLRKVRGLC